MQPNKYNDGSTVDGCLRGLTLGRDAFSWWATCLSSLTGLSVFCNVVEYGVSTCTIREAKALCKKFSHNVRKRLGGGNGPFLCGRERVLFVACLCEPGHHMLHAVGDESLLLYVKVTVDRRQAVTSCCTSRRYSCCCPQGALARLWLANAGQSDGWVEVGPEIICFLEG